MASLALDSAGQPHISTCPYPDHVVRYTYHNATGWHGETVDGFDGGGASLVLDDDSYPHIAYTDDARLAYAYLDSTGWHIETIDALGGLSVSIKLDTAGNPHVGY